MKEKSKKWFEEHKAGLYVAGLSTACVIAVFLYLKFMLKSDMQANEIISSVGGLDAVDSGVDERIFTEIAPGIEKYVLAWGGDMGSLEGNFTFNKDGITKVIKIMMATVKE